MNLHFIIIYLQTKSCLKISPYETSSRRFDNQLIFASADVQNIAELKNR